MKLGLIADDNTGATDAAGMLTERGVRTLLVLDADLPMPAAASEGFEALVVGTQNRAVAPDAAAQTTRRAIAALKAWGAERFQVKYCSTFDSTPQGNIGPALDAALDALEVDATIVCPALPVNQRTVYQGHLFVGPQLLSESALRQHPLNPMTDANLVRWLGYQTSRQIGLAELATVRRGTEAVRRLLETRIAEGCSYIVTDAVGDEDLLAIAEATRDWPLVSGGSGITAAMAAVHYPRRPALRFEQDLAAVGKATLVVSGSQSPMTRRQAEHAVAQGWAAFCVDVPAVLRGACDLDGLTALAAEELSHDRPVLVHSLGDANSQAAEALALGQRLGLSDVETGNRIADALAEVAHRLVQKQRVNRLVVAGGETSAAVCRRLGIQAVEVGMPISPGVPYGFTWPDRRLLAVLKSGNFGTEDLYQRVRDLT